MSNCVDIDLDKSLIVQIYDLQQENQELNKQLEEYKRLGFKHLNDKCNKLENQQKEFIEYLENKIKEPVGYNLLYDNKQQAYKEILSKYNEIIGYVNE